MFDFFDYGATSSIEFKDVDAAKLRVQQYLEEKDQLKVWPTGYTMSLYEYVTDLRAPSTTRFYFLIGQEADRLAKMKNQAGQLVFGEPPKYESFQAYMLSAVEASQAALKREEDASLLSDLSKTYDKSVEDIKKAIDPRLSPLALGVVLVGGYFLFKRVTR